MFPVWPLALLPPLLLAACLAPFRGSLSRSKWLVAVLGLLAFLFTARFLLSGEVIIQKDANLLQLPFLINYREWALANRGPALWNPHNSLGGPSLAHPLSHVLHPTTALAVVLPVNLAFNIGLFFTLFLACCSMFLLARELSLREGAAFVAAVVYGFNEFTLDRLGAPAGPGVEYLYSFACMPLSLALLLRAVGHRSLPIGVLAGVSLAFVLNGNPSLFYYGLLLVGAWLACLCVTVATRARVTYTAVVFAAALLCLFLVNAVELLPLQDLRVQSVEAGAAVDIVGWRTDGVSVGEVGKLFLPNLPRARFAYATRLGWVGLLLAVVALSRPRLIAREILVPTLVLVALGLLLVTRSPLFDLFRDWLPMFSRIGMVPSVFVLLVLPMSLLAGVGLGVIAGGWRGRAVLVGLLAFVEMFGSSAGWKYAPAFTTLHTYDFSSEMADFPHLEAVRKLDPGSSRIDCAAEQYRMMCPDYAVAAYGLRMIQGEGTQVPNPFPKEGVRRLVADAAQNRGLLGVRFVLSPQRLTDSDLTLRQTVPWPGFAAHKEWSMLSHRDEYNEGRSTPWDGTVFIYERAGGQRGLLLDSKDAAKVGGGTPADIDVRRIGSRRVEITGTIATPGVLLVGEPYYPGWSATVDGVSADIMELRGGFIGVATGAGAHSIVLRYDPSSFVRGYWVSLASGMAVLLMTGLAIRLAVKDRSD